MIRRAAASVLFAVVGVTLGWSILSLDLTGRVWSWPVLLTLAASGALLAYPLSNAVLRFERVAHVHWHDHLHHMACVYPCWILGGIGLGGGHGALFFLYPFFALSGVMLGNLAAIARAIRTAA